MNRRHAGIAIGAVAVGSILPWASAFGLSVSGIRGDGVITLVLALVGGGLLAARRPSSPTAVWVTHVVLAGLAALVAGIHIGGFAALGVYVTFLAAIGWGWVALQARTSAVAGDSEGHPPEA